MVMYNRFNDKGAHSIERVQIANDFWNLAFARHVAKCQDDIQLHLCKVGFMSNYLVWSDHREV
jgi:hypothetical protein